MRNATKFVVNLNRPGGEAELADGNDQPAAIAGMGLQDGFHCFARFEFPVEFPFGDGFNLARIALALAVPTIFTLTAPLMNRIKVGTDWMPYKAPRSGLSSTSTLNTLALPLQAPATSSSTGSNRPLA